MRRILSLSGYLFRYHLLRILEFRTELIGWILVSIMWPIIFLLSINLIFGQVSAIAGWRRNDVLLLAAIYELFTGMIWTFIVPSLLNFTKSIRKGGFDFYLTKPISSRILVSINQWEFDQYGRIALMLGVIIYLIPNQSLPNIFFGFLMLLIGLIIFYNFFFIISTTIFWFINLFNIEDLFTSLMDTGRFPVYIFQKAFFLTFVYIIPVAFIATFPAQIILGKGSIQMFLEGILMIIILFFLSDKFWHFALKRYSSASS